MKQASLEAKLFLGIVFHVGIDDPPVGIDSRNAEIGGVIPGAQMQQQRGRYRVVIIQAVDLGALKRGYVGRQRVGRARRVRAGR